jgi:hypothetical protein
MFKESEDVSIVICGVLSMAVCIGVRFCTGEVIDIASKGITLL